MPDTDRDVKSFGRRVTAWIDCHPRTGWYIAVWAALVSINAAVGIVDMLLHALS